MKWLTSLFKTDKKEELTDGFDEEYDDEEYDDEVVDEVYEATISSDISRKIKATELHTDNIMYRNLLLESIISECYRLRKDEYYLKLCVKFCEIHLSEFNKIADAYIIINKQVLFVPVFQNYAMVLTEIGEFEKAIQVCEKAISYGLDDGTKGGYESRIERIKKKMPKDENSKKTNDNTHLINAKADALKEESNYTIGEIRQYIREVVREAKNTARVDSGLLQSSINGAYDGHSNTVEFRQIFYGAENDNSKLTEIAEKRMPKDIKWKVILETNMF